MRRKFALTVSVLCLGLLSACGIRGDLKRPDPIMKRDEQPKAQIADSTSIKTTSEQDAGASNPN